MIRTDTTQTAGKKSNVRFGELLLSKGLIQNEDLNAALNEQKQRGDKPGPTIKH